MLHVEVFIIIHATIFFCYLYHFFISVLYGIVVFSVVQKTLETTCSKSVQIPKEKKSKTYRFCVITNIQTQKTY